MKRILIILFICSFGFHLRSEAQAAEIKQLILNIEKLSQLKKILSNMKKGYEILSAGYNTIEDLSEGNFSLHKTFLDGLLQVNPEVGEYRKIAEIVHYQLILVEEYKTAYARFKQDGYFSPDELAYLETVYDKLFDQSIDHLDELTMVITAGELRMTDDERLAAIDRIHFEMYDKLLFLRHFNNDASILAVQRARESADAQAIKELYRLNY